MFLDYLNNNIQVLLCQVQQINNKIYDNFFHLDHAEQLVIFQVNNHKLLLQLKGGCLFLVN